MQKLPPIEKISEAYTAVEDNRIIIYEDYAIVKSSNLEKEYLVKWKGNIYYSNDSATYWQGYPGYPILAILMLQNKISLNKNVSNYFKNIDWNKLNKETKRDYKKSLEEILKNLSQKEKDEINNEMNKVYQELKNLNIEITKKKTFS